MIKYKNNKSSYKESWLNRNIVGILSLLISISLLAWVTYDLQLKNRPYLYIDLNIGSLYYYSTPQSENNLKVPISIVFHNRGNVPASDVKVSWDIRDDFGNRPSPDEFYKSEYGKIPEYKTVFPNETAHLPDYKPDISPATTRLIINAKVYYIGTSRKWWFFGPFKQYWYNSKSECTLEHNKEGKVVSISLSYFYTDWDKII